METFLTSAARQPTAAQNSRRPSPTRLPILEDGLLDRMAIKKPTLYTLSGGEYIVAMLYEHPVLIRSDIDILRLFTLSGLRVRKSKSPLPHR